MSAVDKELGFAELAEQLSTIHGIRQWGRVTYKILAILQFAEAKHRIQATILWTVLEGLFNKRTNP